MIGVSSGHLFGEMYRLVINRQGKTRFSGSLECPRNKNWLGWCCDVRKVGCLDRIVDNLHFSDCLAIMSDVISRHGIKERTKMCMSQK